MLSIEYLELFQAHRRYSCLFVPTKLSHPLSVQIIKDIRFGRRVVLGLLKRILALKIGYTSGFHNNKYYNKSTKASKLCKCV